MPFPDVLFFVVATLHALMLGVLVMNLIYLRRQPSGARAADTDLPKLSVLIPARNEEDNLQRLLPSLLAQDYPDVEFIVYDDASTDGTWAVLQAVDDPRLRTFQGSGPPEGWVGKVHALYQATRHATGDRYCFLDADTLLTAPDTLRRLTHRFDALPDRTVLTGLPKVQGGGLLLVSMVPSAILGGLPWPLVRRFRSPSLSALNGQFWMIDAADYRQHEPHEALPAEVLEDVQIGRYLKRLGYTPVLTDLIGDVEVFMYRDHHEAWRGFRKNAYLLLGGTPAAFSVSWLFFITLYLLPFVLSPWLVASAYLLKAIPDRIMRYPWWVTLLTPVSFALSIALQLDSALSHWTGRVAWKGRPV